MNDTLLSYLPLIAEGLAVVRLGGELYLQRGRTELTRMAAQLPPGSEVSIRQVDGSVWSVRIPPAQSGDGPGE